MKHVNREGPAHRLDSVPLTLTADYIMRAIANGEMVLDTRPAAAYADCHAKGTINIPANKAFLNWAGAILPYDKDIFVIGDASEAGRHQLARDLALIGIERVVGVFPADLLDELATGHATMSSTERSTVDDVRSNTKAAIIDVRAASEFSEGHIPSAINIPLSQLAYRLDEVPAGPAIVHCQGGSRSAIAASILQRNGRDDVSNMSAGFAEWERMGNKVERGSNRH
jgi:hydroxyacylglutathione hydrolase